MRASVLNLKKASVGKVVRYKSNKALLKALRMVTITPLLIIFP